MENEAAKLDLGAHSGSHATGFEVCLFLSSPTVAIPAENLELSLQG